MAKGKKRKGEAPPSLPAAAAAVAAGRITEMEAEMEALTLQFNKANDQIKRKSIQIIIDDGIPALAENANEKPHEDTTRSAQFSTDEHLLQRKTWKILKLTL
jgi:hypothetical protein